MAFAQHRLEKIHLFGAASKESPELSAWSYTTTDTLATVFGVGYFNNMAKKDLKVGDRLAVSASDGSQAAKVTAVSLAGVVTIKKTGSVAGQSTTVAASDTIVTGLTTVTLVVATLNDAPVIGCAYVSADIGDQAGAPAAGSFLLKTWKPTAAGDATPVAATTFGKKVNWLAFGT